MATFTLLVPVYNEERTLDSVLDKLLVLPKVTELIVVDDGSKDGTAQLLRRRLASGASHMRVVTHEKNQGKGAAIRSGLAAASSEFLTIQDADSEYDPADLMTLFSKLEGGSSVVFGSRFLRPNPTLYPAYLLGNKALTAVVNTIGGGRLTDAYTCYKGMSVDRWRQLELNSDGFEIEAEISIKALRSGWRITEIPIVYRPRSFAEGKKIRGRDAVKGVLTMLRFSSYRPKNGSR